MCEKTNDVKVKLSSILNKTFDLGIDNLSEVILNENFLGNYFKLSARDLLYLYVTVEKEFTITIPEEDIVKGRFNTFNNIVEIIVNQLCNIEQKVV